MEYCEFTDPKQRPEIRPLVEKFLKRSPEFEKFCRPELEKTLKTESPRMKFADGKTKGATHGIAEYGTKPAFHLFLILSIVIPLVMGAVWLAVKKRGRV